ncbi:hypothetical protein J4426_03670 [Candidatus Woesearchaeota archaeon]|nr:hypothetical protein [Candidatus Woesearchaeota archaeon]
MLVRACLNRNRDWNYNNRNLDNSNSSARIAQKVRNPAMKSCNNIYNEIILKENLVSAYKKARKGKSKKEYTQEFRKNFKTNISKLSLELISHIYNPKPLKTFIVRDPKTRRISKSDFRDRIVHHALVNIIEPIFEKYRQIT